MNINKFQGIENRLAAAFLIVIGINLLVWLLPFATTWNPRVFDFFFSLRNESSYFRPDYHDTIVHIDLDDTSIQQLNNYFINRSHFARVVDNLGQMRVAAQLHDFIFAAPSVPMDDRALIEKTEEAGNAYYGLAFKLKRTDSSAETPPVSPETQQYFTASSWSIPYSDQAAGFIEAEGAIISYLPLAASSQGLGFLNMTPDVDGVFRRVPLLIRFQDRLYPSLPFRVICDYLGVPPSAVTVGPGNIITLQQADPMNGSGTHDIAIPVDDQGRLIIDYIGSWDRMDHYHFSDIWLASDDRDEMEIWQEELQGKIVVVADVTTGSSDVGPVPTESAYPLSGLNASVLHTILAGSFIKETPVSVSLFVQVALLSAILILSYFRSTALFSAGTFVVIALFIISAGLLFMIGGLIIDIVTPVLVSIGIFIAFQVFKALDHARELRQTEMERGLYEKELEIGRQIQSDFFPEELPEVSGWEIDAFFKPARQVAGDFYDIFELANRKLVAVVVADVCDKGVGAALFMAVIRSLIRATSNQIIATIPPDDLTGDQLEKTLRQTALVTSNYIAENHLQTSMFATLFLAILNPAEATLYYVNCGSEPAVILNRGEQKTLLTPTGPVIGILPGLEFTPRRINLDYGDLLFACTDGVLDAKNSAGERFNKERLNACLTETNVSGSSLIQLVNTKLDEYTAGASQFDDITMVALSRNRVGQAHCHPV